MNNAKIYDIAVAWNWEYDQDFVDLIRRTAELNGLSMLEIHTQNIDKIIQQLKGGELGFRFLLDRASDEDEAFQSLALYVKEKRYWGENSSTQQINQYDFLIHAADKATMHLEFLSNGIDVPYTIIISPYNHKREVELSISELAKLGRPFIIKPANTTGGGIGVVMGAETLKEIIDARQVHKNDKYLLQETIRPIELGNRRAWFRVFYAFGEIIPCWWDDITHIYSEVTQDEERKLSLERLRTITRRIYSTCQLDFFSTELVYTSDGRCVAVDYVNELCDMRLKSVCADGVPDNVVKKITNLMIYFVKSGVNS